MLGFPWDWDTNMKLRRLWLALLLWQCLRGYSFATTYYVDINSPNPTPPYGDPTTAATSIQDAVDAATNGDLILVNDGYYQDGWRAYSEGTPGSITDTNRLVILKHLAVQSLNGPSAAYIDGGGMYRCVFLLYGATLSGFTLVNASAGWTTTTTFPPGQTKTETVADYGGAIGGSYPGPAGTVSNCVLTSCTATADGGAAYAATLINCIITGNYAKNGGGAANSTLINCQVYGNSVPATGNYPLQPGLEGSGEGGGIYAGSAINCLITGNTAFAGGGVWGPEILVNCTVAGNSAAFYGGISPNTGNHSFYGEVSNSIVYFNAAGTNANYGPGPQANLYFNYCCTLPMPSGGIDNLTNDPDLVSPYGNDFHLNPDSLLINSGCNEVNTNTTDLDGNPRIAGGTVDIGTYEYQSPASVLGYAWAQQYGFPTDGSADYADPDGDGMNNWQEFVAGTNPTNAASVLVMNRPAAVPVLREVLLSWQSVGTRTYYLQRATSLTGPPGFSCIQSNITGYDGTTSYFDTTATNSGPYYYRVGVQ